MDCFAGGVGHRLNNHVVVAVFITLKVKQIALCYPVRHQVRIFERALTDLTLQPLPYIRVDIGHLLLMFLPLQPLLQTTDTNMTHAAGA